jgi:hypothetical protein
MSINSALFLEGQKFVFTFSLHPARIRLGVSSYCGEFCGYYYSILRYDAMWFDKQVPAFWRNMLTPSSLQKMSILITCQRSTLIILLPACFMLISFLAYSSILKMEVIFL